MKKVKYMLKKIKGVDYKSFYNHAKKIAKKVHKPAIFILFDMAWCALRYGSGYMDYFEFEFYLLKGRERKTYLTGRLNNEIVRKYNDKKDWDKLDDKIKFNHLFKKYLGRDFIDLRESSLEEFKKFLKGKDKVVAKPIDDCGGKGVLVLEEFKNVKKIYEELLSNKQYLVEEYLIQHEDLSKLYPDSVNGLRVLSFLDDKGVAHILNVILRIGNNGKVDNFSSGGMYTFVDNTGHVYAPAIDEAGNIYEKHPFSNEKIVGFKVPHYEDLDKMINKLSLVVPSVRYVGWDIAVTKNGLVVLEGNQYPGIFQVKPSLSGKKEGMLLEYRKYMDI